MAELLLLPAGVSAPPRLTVTPGEERRPGYGPTGGPVHSWGHTRKHTEPQHGDPPATPGPHLRDERPGPDPAPRGRRGQPGARPGRAGGQPGGSRRRPRPPSGRPGRGCRPWVPGRQGQARQRPRSPDVSNFPAAGRNLSGPREGRGAGRGGAGRGRAGQGCPGELLPLRSPAGGAPRAERSGAAAAAALSMAATVGWQGKETWSCTTVARISTRA